jgi:hypothetical protein
MTLYEYVLPLPERVSVATCELAEEAKILGVSFDNSQGNLVLCTMEDPNSNTRVRKFVVRAYGDVEFGEEFIGLAQTPQGVRYVFEY